MRSLLPTATRLALPAVLALGALTCAAATARAATAVPVAAAPVPADPMVMPVWWYRYYGPRAYYVPPRPRYYGNYAPRYYGYRAYPYVVVP